MTFLFHDRRNSNNSLTLSNIIFRREAFANLTGDANLLTKVKNANKLVKQGAEMRCKRILKSRLTGGLPAEIFYVQILKQKKI